MYGRLHSSATRSPAPITSNLECLQAPGSLLRSVGRSGSGSGDGIPIEDLGIPGIPYQMTKDDLMSSNKDLLALLHQSAQRGRPIRR